MKEEQKEFPNLPARSPLGKASVVYLKVKDEMDILKESLDKAKAALIEQFIASGKNAVKIDGRKLVFSHKDVNVVQIKRAD